MPAGGGIPFGQYLLSRRIARGGMAEVFLAQQRGLEGFDRRVAVKRILPHLADSPDFLKMFLGEARLAAQLTHPNIVHIYDFGKVDHDYFIAMEYVDGVHAGDLFKLAERQRMSPVLVARLGADAATALHYAHELVGSDGRPLGLVHRDVSPANLMVSYDGVVKLCDFGIAKAAALSQELTNPGHVKGKYAYMSPEQTVAAPLDGRSDVFSLAIVLWELLSGKTIVPRGDAVAAMRAIRDGKYPAITEAAPSTPPALARAIAWALETRRERRATAAELSQALEAFIKSSPDLATPMQLGAWVRTRFPRETTGTRPAVAGGVGTNAGPGTFAAPGTAAAPRTATGTAIGTGTRVGAATSSSKLIAASQRLDAADTEDDSDDRPTIALDEHATVLDDLARKLRDRPSATTVIDGTHTGIETLESGNIIIDDDLAQDSETLERPWKVPPPSQPPAPTRASPTRTLGTQSLGRPTPVPTMTEATLGIRKQPRWLVPLVALGAVAVASFAVALIASSSCGTQASVTVPDAAAAPPPPPRPPPADGPVAAPADGADRADRTTILVVQTTPPSAQITVGKEVRQAPATFALPAGRYRVIAELDGWQREVRDVDLDLVLRDHLVQEIVFAKKLPGPTPPPSTAVKRGKLVARTRPYSEVFQGATRLGETPCELDLPVGTHTLTFRNPAHRPVQKAVVITAGKPAKLNFDLPAP
ncbi:MAG: protein kinase [Deltaproteobacteria bacterium]|nr:protein kinase [Deltaproteobacteria bacterium]